MRKELAVMMVVLCLLASLRIVLNNRMQTGNNGGVFPRQRSSQPTSLKAKRCVSANQAAILDHDENDPTLRAMSIMRQTGNRVPSSSPTEPGLSCTQVYLQPWQYRETETLWRPG